MFGLLVASGSSLVPFLWHAPGLPVGLIVGFYWARVVKLVLKSRRQTGRAANFVPPEPLGRVLRVVWYPTVVLWVVLPFVVAFSTRLADALWWRSPWVTWPAVGVGVVLLYLTTVCWRRMGTAWRMGIDPDETNRLIFGGPFAYVRHPIYTLSSLLMLATLVAVPHPAMFVLAAVHLSFLQWEARREERHLLDKHGAPYEAYMSRVGRFVPKSLAAYRP